MLISLIFYRYYIFYGINANFVVLLFFASFHFLLITVLLSAAVQSEGSTDC